MGWTFNPFTGRLDATGSLSGIVTGHGHSASHISAGTFGSWYSSTPGDYIFPQKVGIGSLATPGVVPASLHIAETYDVSSDPWVYKLWIQGDIISGILQEDGGYVGLLIQPDTTGLNLNGFAYEMWGVDVMLPPLMATSTCTAIAASVNNSQAVTMASGRAVDATIYNLDAGGSITNARVYSALIDTGLGTMSRGYLFHGEYSGAGTVTDKWGIYIDGADKNYLDGNVGIGVWPEWNLHVAKGFNLATLPIGDNSNTCIYTTGTGSATGVPDSTGIYSLSISTLLAGDYDSGNYWGCGLYNDMRFSGEGFDISSLTGIRNDMWISGSSDMGELVMWESLFWHLGSGEIADVIGCAITIGINGGGSIPLSYLYYGVYSDGSGTMSEKWGIYIGGADYNYLSGLLEVDNLSPLNLTDTFIPFFNASAGLVDSILSQPNTQGLVIGDGSDVNYALTFNSGAGPGIITWQDEDQQFIFNHDVMVQTSGDTHICLYSSLNLVTVGLVDTLYGTLQLFGQATGSSQGGIIKLELAADYDGTIADFRIQSYADDLLIGPSTDTDALKLDALKDFYITSGSLVLPASEYANFGGALGSGGYGFRDNAGEMEYKDSGDSWIAFNSLGGSASTHFYFPSGW